MLLELGEYGAVLEFEFDENSTKFKKDFFFWRLQEDALEFIFYALTKFVALREFAGVVITAGQVGKNYEFPVAVYFFEDISAQLDQGIVTSSMSTHLLRARAARSQFFALKAQADRQAIEKKAYLNSSSSM